MCSTQTPAVLTPFQKTLDGPPNLEFDIQQHLPDGADVLRRESLHLGNHERQLHKAHYQARPALLLRPVARSPAHMPQCDASAPLSSWLRRQVESVMRL